MKKILILLITISLLTGCERAKQTVEISSESVEITSTSESYYKMINLNPSDSRTEHYLNYSGTTDLMTIGRGLQVLSNEYFSMSSYYMSEGQYLSSGENKELRAFYNSDEHPYSLELSKEEQLQGMSELDMVEDIHEQNYYKKSGNDYKLSGVSFAIILNPRRVDGQPMQTSITENTLKEFGERCISKLYKAILEMEGLEEIREVPVLITVYRATDSSKSAVDGNYILKSYCDGSVGKVTEVNHKNVIFTSRDAKVLDPATYNEFETIKNNIKEASIESSSIVGIAKYIDNKIQSMTINAHLNIKTYTEAIYLTSVLENNIDSRFSSDFTITVLVYSQDELLAVIIKNSGEEPITQFL